MKLRTAFISALLLISTPLLIAKPAFSAETILSEHSRFIWTTGPVTQSLYLQRAFVKRLAGTLRRDPLGVAGLCDFDDARLNDTIGRICRYMLTNRTDRLLQAADANQCLKARWPIGSYPGSVISTVTVDNSRFCK